MKLLLPTSTVRLRLDDDFRVESVTSAEGGQHLFFRVRGQNTVMVSLGALAGSRQEVTLTIRYSGTHEPAAGGPGGASGRGLHRAGAPFDRRGQHRERPRLHQSHLLVPAPPAGRPRDHRACGSTCRWACPRSPAASGSRPGSRARAPSWSTGRIDPAKYVTRRRGAVLRGGRPRERRPAHAGLRPGAHARRGGRAAAAPGGSSPSSPSSSAPAPTPTSTSSSSRARRPGGHARRGWCSCSGGRPCSGAPCATTPRTSRDEPDFFLAHEIAHQWFGQGVAGANYRERWLSEGFAQYAAALWVRESRGERPFRDVLDQFARWAIRYDDEGPIHIGYRVGHLRGDAQAYRAVIYDKAAYVLHMLRGVTGTTRSSAACARTRRPTATARREPTTCGRRWRPRRARNCAPTSRPGSWAPASRASVTGGAGRRRAAPSGWRFAWKPPGYPGRCPCS